MLDIVKVSLVNFGNFKILDVKFFLKMYFC